MDRVARRIRGRATGILLDPERWRCPAVERLLGNTGERGTFVLPLRVLSPDGKDLGCDDFTFEASSWTLTAHEGRPGHELQFASIIERGISTARVLFAANSVNVEGWALYAEAEMKPYEPLDGQLIALQHRLLRVARAFIDPELQLGRMTRAEAFRVLEEAVPPESRCSAVTRSH